MRSEAAGHCSSGQGTAPRGILTGVIVGCANSPCATCAGTELGWRIVEYPAFVDWVLRLPTLDQVWTKYGWYSIRFSRYRVCLENCISAAQSIRKRPSPAKYCAYRSSQLDDPLRDENIRLSAIADVASGKITGLIYSKLARLVIPAHRQAFLRKSATCCTFAAPCQALPRYHPSGLRHVI